MAGLDIECPACGSADVCYEHLTPRTDGFVCDRCGHEWDVTPVGSQGGSGG